LLDGTSAEIKVSSFTDKKNYFNTIADAARNIKISAPVIR